MKLENRLRGLSYAVICLSGIASETYAQKRPNIVFIMSDDHSYQTISAYGGDVSRLAPTPNIDRIGDEGMRFDRAFVENSLSTPSRACLMTGLYSNQNGQMQLNEGIDTTKTFVSEYLQQAGYQTAAVGKWHMMCEPKGFDFYRVLQGQGDYYNPLFKSHDSEGQYVKEQGYATELITEHAIEFLNSRDEEKPFALFILHKAPHRDWKPDLKYLGLYDKIEFPLPETFWDDYATRGEAAHTQKMRIAECMTDISDNHIYDYNEKVKANFTKFLTPAQRKTWDAYYEKRNKDFIDAHLTDSAKVVWKYQRYLHDYLSVIHSIDESVGDIYEYLERNGLLENTMLVYASDQGFYMGEHGWFDKRFMYEESFRTPLLIRYPGTTNAQHSSDKLVQNIDFVPTLLDAAGVTKPKELPGHSLLPLLKGEPVSDWRTSLYYHYYDYPAWHMVRKHDGVRTERYKLIHFYGKGGSRAVEENKYQLIEGSAEYSDLQYLKQSDAFSENDSDLDYYELYDLENDPNELNNVEGQREYKKIEKDLKKLLEQYRKEILKP